LWSVGDLRAFLWRMFLVFLATKRPCVMNWLIMCEFLVLVMDFRGK
jgi:hypothetical protein